MKKVLILRIEILFLFCLGIFLVDSLGDKEEFSLLGVIDKFLFDVINKNI